MLASTPLILRSGACVACDTNEKAASTIIIQFRKLFIISGVRYYVDPATVCIGIGAVSFEMVDHQKVDYHIDCNWRDFGRVGRDCMKILSLFELRLIC